MARGPFWYFSKACWYSAYAQSSLCVLYALRSRYGTDAFFDEHWAYATPVTSAGSPTLFGQWWWPSTALAAVTAAAPTRQHGRVQTLSASEQRCIDAMARVMAFQELSDAALWGTFAPSVQFHDTLVVFDTLAELRDGWQFMACFFQTSAPVMTEIRREVQDGSTVFLHAKVQTDCQSAMGLASFVFPSAVTLELDKFGKICSVEHRWFGGPFVSRRTVSLDNVLGDVGDLSRRFSGFVLSLIITGTYAVRSPHERMRTNATPDTKGQNNKASPSA